MKSRSPLLKTVREFFLLFLRLQILMVATSNDSHNPNWISESSFTLVYSLEEILELEVMNHHRVRKPSLIGQAVLPLSLLEEDSRRVGVERPIFKHTEKVVGSLLFDVFYYPTTSPEVDEKRRTKSSEGHILLCQ